MLRGARQSQKEENNSCKPMTANGTERAELCFGGGINGSRAYKMDKTTPDGEARWYAVSTRSRQEKVAASMLADLGIRHFHPLITEVHRWSDRKKVVSRPLFPCYLFVRIARSCETQLRVLKVPGIVNFVGSAHGPTAIREEEIESVRAVLSSGIACVPHSFLEAGDRVRIVRGVLAGIEGTFIRSGPDSKLVISIEMIQRSMAINIDGCDIEHITPGRSSYVSPAQTTFSTAGGPLSIR
jgi:transcription antitermination factor NusG